MTSPNRLEEPEWLFPFDFMKIGESFFIPTLNGANMIYVVDSAAKRSKVRIKAYQTVYNGYIGIRVWKTG